MHQLEGPLPHIERHVLVVLDLRRDEAVAPERRAHLRRRGSELLDLRAQVLRRREAGGENRHEDREYACRFEFHGAPLSHYLSPKLRVLAVRRLTAPPIAVNLSQTLESWPDPCSKWIR